MNNLALSMEKLIISLQGEENMKNNSFGETIKQLRIKKKLSQKDLADQLGICNTTLSQYEKNKRAPKFETLLKLADILSVSTDYLLNADAGDQYGTFQTSEIRQFEKLKAMHKNLYNLVLELADANSQNQEVIYRVLAAYLSMFKTKKIPSEKSAIDAAFYPNFPDITNQPLFVNEDSEKDFNKK